MEVIKKYLPNKPYLTRGSVMFLASLLILGIFVPTSAEAVVHDSIVGVFVDGVGGLLISSIGWLLSFLLVMAAGFANFAGSFMDWVLNWDMFYTKCAGVPENECFIDIGWKLTRDLVNALLIVALVVIAFSTILGKREYGITSSLIPLMLVALLVNFSRVIVGMVIDGANIVMDVFVQAMPGIADSTSSITKSAGVGGFSDFSLDTATAVTRLFETVIMIIFFFGLGFILFLYGIIFAVRFAMLWMLTIMSPIAFIAYIFPTTKKIFNFWRDQLIQWAIIGIPVLFFLWLAILFAARMDGMVSSDDAGFFAAIMPNIFLLVLLAVAFILGLRTSAMGSAAIISTGKKLGAAAGMFGAKWGGKLTYRAGMMGGRAAGRQVKEGAGKFAGTRAGRRVGVMAGRVGALAGRVRSAPEEWRLKNSGKEWDKKSTQKDRLQLMKDAGVKGRKKSRLSFDNLSHEDQRAIRREMGLKNAKEKWDKNTKMAEQLIRDSGLKGTKNKNGVNIRPNMPFDSLTPEQQDKLGHAKRIRLTRLAGRGASLAKKPWNLMTPEEQQDIMRFVTADRLRNAKKNDVQNAMKSLEERGFGPDELEKTIDRESNPSKKLAAQILFAREGAAFKNKYPDVERQQAKIATEAKKLGFENDVTAYLGKDVIEEMYKGDVLKMGQKMRKATSIAAKSIKELVESMADLADNQLAEIATKSTNLHEKVAATQRLADRLKLDSAVSSPGEQKKLIEVAGQFNQEHLILRRYLHKTKDEKEMKNVVGKMTDRDYPFVHRGILNMSTPEGEKHFKEFYKHASRAGIGQMVGRKDLASGMQAIADNAKNDAKILAILEGRKDIDRFMRIRAKSNVVFGIPWTGKQP